MDPDPHMKDPPGESRSRRGPRRRDQGDDPSSSSSSSSSTSSSSPRQHDLGGGRRFIGRTQQRFQSYPQYDPYSDTGSHGSHHRASNRGHSHHHGSQGSYQNAYKHGHLHKRLSQGQAARHQPHDHEDGSTWRTDDSFTYHSQQSVNAHRQQQNHRREDYLNNINERHNDGHIEEEGYDHYDVIVPKSAARHTSSLGNRVSRSSSSLSSNRHSRSRNNDSYTNLEGPAHYSKSKHSRPGFQERQRASMSMDDMASLQMEENRDHRSFEEDQFVGKNGSRVGRFMMQSSSSIGSGRRRGRTRSDYSHGEGSDYNIVGGSAQSMHRRIGSDQLSDDVTYDYHLDDDENEKYNHVQTEEEVYDYYDVIVPNPISPHTSSKDKTSRRSSSSSLLVEPAKKMPAVITGGQHHDANTIITTNTQTQSRLASMFSSSLRIISGHLPTAAHLRHASPLAAPLSSHSLLHLRGGSSDDASSRSLRTSSAAAETKYVTLDSPAPGSPFHYAFPVHSLEEAKKFYGNVLGCKEGRSSEKWQDYSLNGHQIVCHWVGDNYRCVDYYNPVDGDEVPVPHAGLALTVEQFHKLAERVRKAGVRFIIEPHLRFKDAPGEQWTMFFKDPSGNNLEFKAMTKMENLFAKYNVVD